MQLDWLNTPGLSAVSAWGGCALLLLSLLLMLREPALARRLGGWETMARAHHRAGVWGYALLLLHTLGWAQRTPSADWVVQSLSHPALFLGWLALLGLMAGLALSFSQTLPPRRWRALHQLLGLCLPLGLLHALLLGPQRPTQFVLQALLALALATLGWRALVINRGLSAQPYRVCALQHPTSQVVTLRLEPLALPLALRPGQFVLARFPVQSAYAGCGEFHPFSVSAVGAQGRLELTIKDLGRCSGRLQQVPVGADVQLQGPFGRALDPSPGKAQLWVAGGIGITPFMAALRQGPPSEPTTLLYLYRQASEATFLDELLDLERELPNLQLLHAQDPQAQCLDGLLARVAALAAREVQVCGPPALLRVALPRLHAAGVTPGAIHVERFELRS
ncbi:putative ferric reductase [Inhella inkyongensis]|uniref:Putative ferric reductase n=1 Tax=Inhella inkyongensis TaxID=392593 RepID=A0A840S8Z7_9BURK|nr:ferric reductase-like transmembrane domain-containing protein [Inhella inkyongensis]MBB5206092.1 putative ferric reductase [Inhella inkyongensis]